MKKGDKVLFNGDSYRLLHIYTSGYCEIKEINGFDIKLVKLEQITKAEAIA